MVSATLTDEGKGYINAFPEENLIKELSRSKLEVELSGKNQIALIWAKKNGWITVEGRERRSSPRSAKTRQRTR